MPRGFMGRPATAYLTKVSSGHSKATEKSTRIATNAPSNAVVRERRLPFEPSEGNSGGLVPTGRGNSSNILVSQSGYDVITRMISQADDKVGECMYNIAQEIEALCQTAFVLPDAVPRCLNISETVKKSLGEFREVTEDAGMQMRRFAHEIDSIG